MTPEQALALARRLNLECEQLGCARCERIRARIAEFVCWVLDDPEAAVSTLGRDA